MSNPLIILTSASLLIFVSQGMKKELLHKTLQNMHENNNVREMYGCSDTFSHDTPSMAHFANIK